MQPGGSPRRGQRGGRARVYAAYPVTAGFRLQGDKEIPRFIQECINAGAPATLFDGVEPAGPLASFDGADTWVEHPYADGIVLIGDAAATSDPRRVPDHLFSGPDMPWTNKLREISFGEDLPTA
ncbi:MAG TPA: hypothetical protein VEK56_09060 [Vicinamibacterales bacterium]|nr:hypothetical protein [Vicinamibacterales bacterium]